MELRSPPQEGKARKEWAVYEFPEEDAGSLEPGRKDYGEWRVLRLLCINSWGKCACGFWPLGGPVVRALAQLLLRYKRGRSD